VGDAAGEMGSGIASAASRVSGLASLVGSSGPFGIAIAAGTIAWLNRKTASSPASTRITGVSPEFPTRIKLDPSVFRM